MEITVNRDGSRTNVGIKGAIDEEGSKKLKLHLSDLGPETEEVVIDFSQVSIIGSAGIGQLMMLYKIIALNGGTVRIENVSDHTYKLFELIRLTSIFTVTKA